MRFSSDSLAVPLAGAWVEAAASVAEAEAVEEALALDGDGAETGGVDGAAADAAGTDAAGADAASVDAVGRASLAAARASGAAFSAEWS
jgi:hypothetical protein